MAAAKRKKQVIVQFDRELLARLDNHTADYYRGNRSRALAHAVEVMRAQHAAFKAEQAVEAMLARHAEWQHEQALVPLVVHDPGSGVRHTSDTESGTANRPLTRELMDLFGDGRW